MELGLTGKRALVTGAGRGLGCEIAQSLAREGATVAGVSRTVSDLEKLQTTLDGYGNGHLIHALDLAHEDGPTTLLKVLKERDFYPIDIIVHNLGGTLEVSDPFCNLSDWRRVFRLNLEVAIELNLLFMPKMREQGWGRVVLIGSISGEENHGPIPYCSVKAALSAYGRSLGRVVAPDGVVVTTVLPGAVFTDGGYWDLASKERPEHVKNYLSSRMAIGRFGRPSEIGNVVTFLCSEHASFCIGSVIPVDGGQGRSYFAHD
ncbi:SDR family NAD(P)-dependent oxidoreductase [Nitrospira sp. M1]